MAYARVIVLIAILMLFTLGCESSPTEPLPDDAVHLDALGTTVTGDGYKGDGDGIIGSANHGDGDGLTGSPRDEDDVAGKPSKDTNPVAEGVVPGRK